MQQNNKPITHECFVATYLPRQCGIATFTHDLRQAIGQLQDNGRIDVIAITNTQDNLNHPAEVTFEIQKNQLYDYRLAAEYTNLSGAEVVCLQHEFGIFGGAEGNYITEFFGGLRKPIVTTLHTILPNPPPKYRDSLVRIATLSDHLVVLNSKAIPILHEVYGIPKNKISAIHHGVPDVPFVDSNYYKDKFNVEGRMVILTFGLLSRNKGIELMLEALPDVVSAHPEVIYIVLGATHPEVKQRHGEEYRQSLERQVSALGLDEHVIFYDRFVSTEELCEFICACDIYVTPYHAKDQIVSGTLAYAVGMGKAVISTPYLYAEELLGENRGVLVSFGDSAELTQALNGLIEDEAKRHQMRKRAYEFGRQMIWPVVARQYLDVFANAMSTYHQRISVQPSRKGHVSGQPLPAVKLDYLRYLTDDTAIIQHATYGIPHRGQGYSSDDVARALVTIMMHYRQTNDTTTLDLAARYLSFLAYAQLADGRFHNFMSYDHKFLDDCGSEDTLGRVLWGLGTTVAYAPTLRMRALASEMLERALSHLDLTHPRAMAYAICGLHNFLRHYSGATLVRRQFSALADTLATRYEQTANSHWQWFDEGITYANAKMPQAMLLAYQVLGEQRYQRIGLESLEFLIAETYHDGYFDFVGNQGWHKRGEKRAIFSQQPIEASYTTEACITAYQVTQDKRYHELATASAEWLLGRNRLGIKLYDPASGACADGLDPQGVNLNQGAESVICGLLTFLSMAELTTEQQLHQTADKPALIATTLPSSDLLPLTNRITKKAVQLEN